MYRDDLQVGKKYLKAMYLIEIVPQMYEEEIKQLNSKEKEKAVYKVCAREPHRQFTEDIQMANRKKKKKCFDL